jgi:beta-mannosidase
MKKIREKIYPFLFIVILSFFFIQKSYSQMEDQIYLSGKWKVTWNDGQHGPNNIDQFIRINPVKDLNRYMDVDVPMDLNIAMQKKGIVDDLNYGVNYLKSRWVAEQYWQYYREFDVSEDVVSKSVKLKFDRLDYSARIFLNGKLIGSHNNAFIPCVIDVTGKLKKGKNTITVGIGSGLYAVADKSMFDYNHAANLNVHLNKRHWLRKPQYQFSWDWNPILVNVGITGNVSLIWFDYVRLNNIVPVIEMSDNLTSASVTVRSFIEGTEDNNEFTVKATLVETGEKISIKTDIIKGINPYELKLNVDNPKLWWPVGQGNPNRYTLRVDIIKDGKVVDSGTRKIGFRKIEVDQSKHPVEGTYFTIKVNNRPVFMKGGNWVPADMIYSSVDRKRTEELVNLAEDANFNMLRIWGGGLFAGNDLLDLCDEKGIVVWHDFLFACSKYPGDDVDFYNNVKREVTWAAREFAYHPSLIVWGGNNELEWAAWDWGYTHAGKVIPDYIIYHHLIPSILKQENPTVFYWPSSPYSENNEKPNSPIYGDQHPWGVSLQKDGTNMWAYREYVDRFPNEGGVLGASSPATLRQFLPEDEQYIRSFTWEQHDNLMNFTTEEEGVTYRFVEDWFGVNYKNMSFDDYVFASALLQTEGLSEYINNYHRRMFSSSSAIFWMFNDSWPVTHGWTIVDYYLRKKLAYHPVRRAFSQVAVVVTAENDKINVYGINENQEKWKGKLQYGVFNTDGKLPFNKTINTTLQPNSSTLIATFDKIIFEKADFDKSGAFAVLEKDNANIAQHRLFLSRFKDITLLKPEINIDIKGDYAILSSPVFVWGVTLDIDGESDISDNCFDLIPGVPYIVKITNKNNLEVKTTGNNLMIKIKNR